jgi:SnoaL-like domain
MGKLRLAARLTGFFAGLALGACSPAGDPVRATVDRMAQAAKARDAKALFANVAPGFQAADGSGPAEARETVERYFAAYEMLDVAVRDVRIERGGSDAARVRFRAQMSGQPRRISGLEGLVPSSAAYDFDVRMVDEGGAWKVTRAQWNPAGVGGRND